MSSFIKGMERKARFNKKAIAKQVESALEHDGENWSLLAIGKEIGIADTELFAYFGDFVQAEFGESSKYESNSHKGHTLFSKKVDGEPFECYMRPVGLPTKDGGMDVWDFHINNNVKELYLEYLNKIRNAKKKEV